MPEIVETTVYRFHELSDDAKDKAREWYRADSCFWDYEWYDFIFDDFERICEILGIDLETHFVPLYGGGTRRNPNIYFTGFGSRSDGACFEGRWQYQPRQP